MLSEIVSFVINNAVHSLTHMLYNVTECLHHSLDEWDEFQVFLVFNSLIYSTYTHTLLRILGSHTNSLTARLKCHLCCAGFNPLPGS